MRILDLKVGVLLPNSNLSRGDHIPVDKQVFTVDVHVKVSHDILHYDYISNLEGNGK
jgi:hypothetical protein